MELHVGWTPFFYPASLLWQTRLLMRGPLVLSRGTIGINAMKVSGFLVAAVIYGFPLVGIGQVKAADFGLESAGARFGIGANGPAEHMNQGEAFGVLNLPLCWSNDGHWHLQTRLEISAGRLGGEGESAIIGSLGPGLLLHLGQTHLSLEVGCSPTIISQHTFGPQNLGSNLQFTSHIGLNYDIGSRLRIGYRLQHMSNGGISHPNPGLNMHMFGLSYLF
jgi:lipid A 3-O-deacylase